MLHFIVGLIIGGLIGVIGMCLVSINRDELHPKQFEINIREGLKGKFPFYVGGTCIEVTPWRDGSGVIRIVKDYGKEVK